MKRKGFTLIEMIIVIAIIAVLLLIIVPTSVHYINLSKDVTCKSNMKTIMKTYIVNSTFNENNLSFEELVQKSLEGTKGEATVSGGKATITDLCPDQGTITMIVDGNHYYKSISCSVHGTFDNSSAYLKALLDIEKWQESYIPSKPGDYKDAMDSQLAANGGTFYQLTDDDKKALFGDNTYLGIYGSDDLYIRSAGIILKDNTLADVQIVGVYPSTSGTVNMAENTRTAALIINGEVYAPVNSSGEIAPVYKTTPGSQTIARALERASVNTNVDAWYSTQIGNYTWNVNGELVKFQKIS